MILSVLQPSYFPSVAVCGKILASDVVVWADSFLFRKGSPINRMKIKTIDGGRWLTVPVLTRGLAEQHIKDVIIDNHSPWAKNHLRALQNNYCNSPYYFYYIDELQDVYNQKWKALTELLEFSMQFYQKKIPLETHFVHAGSLPLVAERTARAVSWLKETGCDTYLFEPHEQLLFDQKRVRAQGFSLKLYTYHAEKYHQQFRGFENSMSALDLLFNEGEMSASILKRGVRLRDVN